MIADVPALWGRILKMKNEMMAHADLQLLSWHSSMPTSLAELETYFEALVTLRDDTNTLINEIQFLRGYQDGEGSTKLVAHNEEPNENGDVIIHITPKTAPCSEVAESFGVSTAKIVATARRLGLKPAGRVEWQLANGQFASAGTYSLLQWKQLRDGPGSRLRVNATAPARLLDDESDE